jgi:hypothetical protein
MRGGGYLALSLAGHVAIAAFLAPWARTPRRAAAPVTIRIVETPKALEANAKPRPSGKPKPPAKAASAPLPPKTARTPSTPPLSRAASGYERLLPGGTYQFSFEDGGGQAQTDSHAAIPTDIRISADEISGKLDIPLIFRKKNGTAKAEAKVVRRAKSFVFEYVDGDPYLRAVLFEALRAPAGQAQVLKLFGTMHSAEILIILKLSVVQGSGETGETYEDFGVDGYKLVIAKTTVLGQTNGFYIDDADAKKARRRDEAHLEQLKTSPAFTSPLRNERP